MENVSFIKAKTNTEENRNIIKAALLEYGVLGCSYFHDDYEWSEDSSKPYGNEFICYCYSTYTGSNHAVTLIGWDDNISADNFIDAADDESHPAGDGAWIIQNSWGTGFTNFYISYYDTSFYGDFVALDMMPADSYDYNYFYDGAAGTGSSEVEQNNKIANVYTVDKNATKYQKLEAVGFSTWNNGTTSYEVKVYKDVTDNNPESGSLADILNVTTEYVGAYTFSLNKSVVLAPGTTYSIVISPTSSDACIGAEYTYTPKDSSWTFNAETKPGQSYYYSVTDSAWVDTYSEDSSENTSYCFRIKGFASDVDTPVTSIDFDNTALSLSLSDSNKSKTITPTIAPTNASNKNLTWSSSDTNVATVVNGDVTAVAYGTATITAISAENGDIKQTCTVNVVPDAVVDAGYNASLTLNDNINVNFKMTDLSEGFDNEKLVVKVDGKAITTKYDSKTSMVIGVLKAVVPKDMGTSLNVVVTYKDDIYGDVTIKTFSYSICDYCHYVLEHKDTYGDELYNLCEAVLNYGTWADNYFNKKTYSKINENYVIDFTKESVPVPQYKSNVVSPVSKASAFLDLGSMITLNFKINYTGTGTLDNTKVSIVPCSTTVADNKISLGTEGSAIESSAIRVTDTTGDYNYQISITDIGASQLSKAYKLTINDSENFYIYYGVYDYCNYVANTQGLDETTYPDSLKTLTKAIYKYGECAKAYADSLNK